jgi:sec-independent protein translocase protein TatC
MSDNESFLSHLVELRDRLTRALIAVLLVFLCLFPFASELFDLAAQPLMSVLPEGSKMIATGVVAPFIIPVKIALVAALAIALPYVLYQAWAFIAPGLYRHEKRFAMPMLVASVVLFFAGVAFCYFFVFGVVFRFVYSIAPKSINVAPDIDNYFSFVLGMFVAFGVTFEVPIAVILLVKMGFVTVAKLREMRPYVIVGAFVVAAVVTPPDVLSQIMLAIPLWILYEAGIIAAALMIRGKPAEESSGTT